MSDEKKTKKTEDIENSTTNENETNSEPDNTTNNTGNSESEDIVDLANSVSQMAINGNSNGASSRITLAEFIQIADSVVPPQPKRDTLDLFLDFLLEESVSTKNLWEKSIAAAKKAKEEACKLNGASTSDGANGANKPSTSSGSASDESGAGTLESSEEDEEEEEEKDKKNEANDEKNDSGKEEQ